MKDKILKNVRRISAEQCIKYIEDGVVTFAELQNTGDLQASKQKEIKAYFAENEAEDNCWRDAMARDTEASYKEYLEYYLNGQYSEDAKNKIRNAAENEAWNTAIAKNSVGGYEGFITQFPESKHSSSVQIKIDELRNAGKAELGEWMRKLKENPEDFTVRYVEDLIDEGKFTRHDLVVYGLITEDALQSYFNPPKMLEGANDFVDLAPLPKGNTDIYLIGISYSGKSMILASLLYRASQKGILFDDLHNPIGTQYKDYLIDCMVRGHLVVETPRDTVNYVSCTLTDESSDRSHKLSLLEMSGEFFNRAYEDQNLDALQYIDGQPYLQNDNRKVIYFVIDYSTKINEATQQRAKLLFTLNLLDRDRTLRTTDSIHIIVSKADLIQGEDKEEVIREYLDQNYLGFINQIKRFNKKYGINKNQNHDAIVHPFSVGRFMLGQVFDYDPKTSDELILSLLNSTAASDTKKGWKLW